MAKAKWHNTNHPGVRYREHPTRKHGVSKDRYFAIRYTLNGKRIEEGVGWASEKWTVTNKQTGETKTENWTPEKVSALLNELKKNQRTGEGPQTLTEKRKLAQNEREAEQERIEQEKRDAIKVNQFWEKKYLPFLEENKSLQTVRTEKAYYKNWIKPVIGEKPLNHVVAFDLERIRRQMKNANKSPKTIRDNYAIVRQVINRAKSLGVYSGQNPFESMKKNERPKAPDNKRMRYLTQKEAEDLLKKIYKKSPDLYDMCILALDCGPRAKEIFGLEWSDINFETGLVTFRNTKNDHVRHIPMTNRVKEMMKARKASIDSKYIFPARGGKMRREVPDTFARVVKNETTLNQGIEDRRQKVVFHTLRHTCASWLVIAGQPLYTVKNFLGHQQISQTERYSKLSPDNLQQAMATLNRLHQEQEEKTAEEAEEAQEAEVVDFPGQ